MPHSPHLRRFFGHRWRTVIRPAILQRAGGVFEGRRYIGGARCERCSIPDCYVSIWQDSELDIAHLDGDVANCDESNLAAVCRLCHRGKHSKLDYRVWSLKYTGWLRSDRRQKAEAAEAERQCLIAAADRERPILQLLEAS